MGHSGAFSMKSIKVLASVQSHMPLMATLSHSGVGKRYGLEIAVDTAGIGGAPDRKDRTKLLLAGEYQFLSGLHHEPYFMRARGDKRLVYLAQGQNLWDDRLLCTPDISSLAQLEGKTVFVGGAARCVMGNFKAILSDCGVRLDSIEFVTNQKYANSGNFRQVVESELGNSVQAALVDMPFDLVGKKKGFKVFPLPDRPVVHNVTICASTEYLLQNEKTVSAFLKSFIAAIHFFKANPTKTIDILREYVAPIIGIQEHQDEIRHLYESWKKLLSKKPYPLPRAIQTTFELDAAKDPLAGKLNPIETWDLHYLKEIDDSGFIDALYAAS
jgi:ABC-type nitrate/sulfonate/bicarbonate transport system substrate-binding protein